MSNKITETEAAQIFANLESCTQGMDNSEITAYLGSLEANGAIITVDSENMRPIWEDNQMEVEQINDLLIGGWPVYRWKKSFWGYWGGMGAGWWQEEGDSTLETWLEELLDTADLLPEDAAVPTPFDLEDPEDDEDVEEDKTK